MLKGKQYAVALEETIQQLTSYDECKKSPYMTVRNGERLCLVVIAGDRGLAGGYNANIFRLMKEYPDAEIIPIGKRACDRYEGELLYADNFSYYGYTQ
jgi:F-type H+-transporting ATPase subunit gamma